MSTNNDPTCAASCWQIACFPVDAAYTVASYVFYPVTWVIEKIKKVFTRIIGYFSETGIFSFGVYNNCGQRTIIEIFKWTPCDTNTRSAFDPNRLKESIRTLEGIGATSFTLKPNDGLSEIKGMTLKRQDLKTKIEQMGGEWVEDIRLDHIPGHHQGHTYKASGLGSMFNGTDSKYDIIRLGNPAKVFEWSKFYTEVLTKEVTNKQTGEKERICNMGWKIITIKDGDLEYPALMTAHWKNNKDAKRPVDQCFLRCHSPTESYAFERKWIGTHLGQLRGDVCIFDTRGTYESTGVASEGGYYMDVRRVFEHLMVKERYASKDIWAVGFCLGGAVAADLKRVAPDVNYVPVNSFESLYDTLLQQSFPINRLAAWAVDDVRAEEEEITTRVEQDSFNTAGKLASIPTKGGISFVVNTDTDTVVSPEAHQKLFDAASSCSMYAEHMLAKQSEMEQKAKNGHSLDPLLDHPATFQRYVELVTHKDTFIARAKRSPQSQPSTPVGTPSRANSLASLSRSSTTVQ